MLFIDQNISSLSRKISEILIDWVTFNRNFVKGFRNLIEFELGDVKYCQKIVDKLGAVL
jgi:hypothetical protein